MSGWYGDQDIQRLQGQCGQIWDAERAGHTLQKKNDNKLMRVMGTKEKNLRNLRQSRVLREESRMLVEFEQSENAQERVLQGFRGMCTAAVRQCLGWQ